jgi:copper chaperone
LNLITLNFITGAMKKELQVSGMNCSSCEMLVKEALEELEGVTKAEASQPKGIVSVDYNPEIVSLATLTSVIEEQGFRIKA